MHGYIADLKPSLQVYLLSLELLRKAVAAFAPRLSPEEMRAPLRDAVAKVVAHTGKSQEKVRNESFNHARNNM